MKIKIFALAVVFYLYAPNTASIAETNGATEQQAEATEDNQPYCKKPVKTRGPGNIISSVAELKTIIIWKDLVTKKYGAEVSEWHYAKAKNLKCRKSKGSNYYYCDLSAIPCGYKHAAANTEKQSSEKQGEEQAPEQKSNPDQTEKLKNSTPNGDPAATK